MKPYAFEELSKETLVKLLGAYLRHRPPPAAAPSPPVTGVSASVAAKTP